MASSDSEWRTEIRTKLIEIFQDDVETFVRVQYYLDKVDEAYQKQGLEVSPPVWLTLKAALGSDKAFEGYARRLSEDGDAGSPSIQEDPDNDTMVTSDESKTTAVDLAMKSGLVEMATSALLPGYSQGLLGIIPQIVMDNAQPLASTLSSVAHWSSKFGGAVSTVGLAAFRMVGTVAMESPGRGGPSHPMPKRNTRKWRPYQFGKNK